MEREILFRGKRIDSGEWITGDFSKESDGSSSIRPAGKIIRYRVIPKTLGQFTGLTDKNGKKIFEGDILKAGNGHIGYADFSEGGFVLVCRCHSNLTDLYGAIQEVIGNIHDNPEMLKNETLAEFQPVIHAKWEISSDGYYPYCKKCNARPENGKMTKYCPSCGAKMDGD